MDAALDCVNSAVCNPDDALLLKAFVIICYASVIFNRLFEMSNNSRI